MPEVQVTDSGLRDVVRAVPAEYAFMIGLGLIAVLYLQSVHRPTLWGWLGVAILGIGDSSLQHRSVWVATAAGALWGVRTVRSSGLRWFALATAGLVVVGVMALASPAVREKAQVLLVGNIEEAQGDKKYVDVESPGVRRGNRAVSYE